MYVVTPQLNRLVETVQVRGHNIWFQKEEKLSLSYHQIPPPISSDLCNTRGALVVMGSLTSLADCPA